MVLDSYYIAPNLASLLQSSTDATWRGQSFQCPVDSYISSVRFRVGKVGSPVGDCVARIYAHSGTYGTSSVPTGSVLATSDAVDVSTLSTLGQPPETEFQFTGANQILLETGVYYCVIIEYVSGATIDVSNCLRTLFDNSTASHGGNLTSTTTSGASWTASSGSDFLFTVEGSPVASAPWLTA